MQNHIRNCLSSLRTKYAVFVRFLLVAVIALTTFASAVYTYTRVLTPERAVAATSSNLNYQARLLTAAGNVVPDGYYNIEFKLYDQVSGGTALWTETYYDSNGATAGNDNRVRVVNGYLSVNLASLTAFPGTIDWDQDMWLTMNVGGSTQTATPTYDGEMSPRVKLTAVPYAFQAKQATKLYVNQGSFAGEVDFSTLTANRRYLLPDTSLATTASPGTICVYNGAASNCPAASGSAYYIQNDTVLQQQANFNIQARDSGANGTVGVQIRGAANGQTVDMLQIQAPDGTVLGGFASAGQLFTGSTAALSNTQLSVTAASAGTTGLVVRGAASQTADLLQVQDSSGAILVAFDKDGKLVFGPSGNQDTNLYRDAANILKTDDNLEVVGYLGVGDIGGNPRIKLDIDGTGSFNITDGVDEVGQANITRDGGHPALTFSDAAGNGYTSIRQLVSNQSFPTANGGLGICTGTSNACATGYNQLEIAAGTGATTLRNITDSDNAFRIQNTAGGSLLTADTFSSSINIGAVGGALFVDDFETGDFSLWDSTTNMAIETGTTHSGGNAARATSLNSMAYAEKSIPATGTLYYSAYARFDSGGTDTDILVVTSTSYAFTVYRNNSNNALCAFKNSPTQGQMCTDINMMVDDVWKKIEMRLTSGTAGNFQVYVDGNLEIDWNTNLSTESYTGVQIGNPVAGRTSIVYIDNVEVRTPATMSTTLNANGDFNVVGSSTLFGQTTVKNNLNIGFQIQNAAGTSNLFVANTALGRIGVGTATPQAVLHVSGDGSTPLFRITDTTSTAQDVFNIANGGQTTIKAQTNSENTLRVENTSGNAVLNVDTTNSRVGINLANGTAASALDVRGALTLSGGATTTFTTPVGSTVGTRINIPIDPLGLSNFEQLLAFGMNSSSHANARAISIFDARTVSHQPSIAVFSPNEANALGFSWEGSNTTSYVKTTGGNIGVRSGTTTIAQFNSDGTTHIGATAASSGLLNVGGNTTTAAGGIYFGSDTNLYRAGSGRLQTTSEFDLVGSAANALRIATTVSGDSLNRFELQADGTMSWGDGTASVDTTLYRSAAGQLTTNGDLVVQGGDITTNQTVFNLINTTATTLNIGGAVDAGGINFAGGSSSTGCTIDGSTGNLTCTGTITGSNITAAIWSRVGTVLQPTTAGDSIQTSGNISTTGSGTITSAGLLTGSSGLTISGAASTISGGQIDLNVNSNFTTNINTGTSTGAVNIGNNTGNTAVTIDSGTGAINIGTGAQARTINLGTGAAAQTVNVGSSNGASILSLQGGTGGISLGSAGIANTIQIGNVTGGVAQSINIGTNGTASSTNNINIGSSIAGTTAITGATTITNRTTGSTDTLVVSNSTSTGSIVKFNDNSTTVFSIADGGAATFQNQTNSSTAFQIQNAAGTSLFTADTTNTVISVFNSNPGEPNAWTTMAGSTISRDNSAAVTWNGYAYMVGGDTGGASLATVGYAKINADGTFGTWSTTGTLPAGRSYHAAVVVNGYMYVLGGSTNSNWTGTANTVYYAKINADGTIGNFTSTSTLTSARRRGSAVALNGYMYYIGGDTNSGASPTQTVVDDVQYAKINADGTLGSWSLVTNAAAGIPQALADVRATTANGYIYVLGGVSQANVPQTTVYYVKPAANGDITSAFTSETTNPMPAGRHSGGAYVANGYVYYAGGYSGGYQQTVYYAPLNANGSLGAWTQQNTANDLPANRGTFGDIFNNGYMYAISGYNGGVQSSIYYTSLQRMRINGSLDLVGASGENLAEAGAGGELTAGNTTVVGTLSVRSDANFSRGVAIGGDLNVGGYAAFRNATDSTAAFAIQSANGNSLFNADTSNLNVSILSGNNGMIQQWQSNSSTGFTTRDSTTSVVANGYLYTIGGVGVGAGNQTLTLVQVAKINANGSLGNWTSLSSTPLPAARSYASSAYANGYIYVTGGVSNNADMNNTTTNTVYYAKVNSDGTLGSWQTGNPIVVSATAHPRRDHVTIAANGYLYAISGTNATGGPTATVHYAKLNADGSIGAWAATNAMGSSTYMAAGGAANGYVYILGGNSLTTTQYGKLNADGTVTGWTTGTPLPAVRSHAGIAFMNGYVYSVAGENAAGNTFYASTYSAPLNPTTGNIGAWSCQGSSGDCTGATSINTTALAGTRSTFGLTPVMANGYMYVIGGYNGTLQSTVYYTSTARLTVNASLDLVGLAGGNLADGSTGGTLTAGNTSVLGTLFAQGNASFAQGVYVGDTLTVGGASMMFTDSSSARSIGVQARTTNAAGTGLTISAGNGGAGASAFTGGTLTLQGGSAGGTGNANGGNVTISGGAGTGTGVQGLVNLSTTAFTSSSTQAFGSNGSVTGVDTYSTIPISATTTGLTITIPAPNAGNQVIGRLLYIPAVGSNDFNISLAGTSISIAMKPNSTATLIWNGTGWTAAGASSSTDLQSAYNNTLTSAGGAELVLNPAGGAADGFTIRNNGTTPITGGILEVQSSIGTNLFSVNNLGTELAANGGAETSATFSTNWTLVGSAAAPTRTTTSGQFVTGLAGVSSTTTAAANDGVRNNLSGNPAASTTYQVSFAAKSSLNGTPIDVQYSPNGGSTLLPCASYSSQTLSSTIWTKITCTITSDGTAVSNPDLLIRKTNTTTPTIYIDNLSFMRNDSTTQPSNVQIGGGINGGPITLFTLDRSTAPPVANGDTNYLGSMYYDTTSGRIQCYEADGWGACGSAPDNIISLTPEYAGAVLNGTGVGTMTADFCSNQAGVLQVNTGFCASGLSRQYYKWTSPQASPQTYSIYVSYKLPNTFKQFNSDSTISLTALTDNVTNGSVTYEVFRSTGSAITACGTATTASGAANTWNTAFSNGNEMSGCSFAGGDNVIFKINVTASNNANVYVENLNFTYTNT